MKIKLRFCLYLFFLLSNQPLVAQIWYDANAKWYRYSEDGLSDSKQINEVYIEKDTIWQGVPVKKLVFNFIRRHGITGEETRGSHLYGYEYKSNDSIFHWNSNQQQFNLVYNFNLSKGDTVTYDMYSPYPIDLILDTVIAQNFSGHLRRVQYFQRMLLTNETLESPYFPVEYIVIEGVGSLINRNPMYDFLFATDLPWVELRCFSDSFIEYNPDKLLCNSVDRIVSTSAVETDLDIQVYPNPVHNWLQIKTDYLPITKVSIYDLLGHKIIEANNKQELNFRFLPKGIYFIKVEIEQQSIIKKIIKH